MLRKNFPDRKNQRRVEAAERLVTFQALPVEVQAQRRASRLARKGA